MDTILGLLSIVGLLVLAAVVGDLFRAYPTVFFVLWFAIPIFVIILRYSKYNELLSRKSAKWLRIISVSVVIGVSFCIFSNFNHIRDRIGYENIKGYYSEYYPDTDEYGRSTQGVSIHTSHSLGKLILWLFEWIFVILCFVIPVVTWKHCSVICDLNQESI